MSEVHPDTSGEQRVYIDRRSLGHLACASTHMAWQVSLLLLDSRLAELTDQHISPLAKAGTVRPEFVDTFSGTLRACRDDAYARFGGVQYFPRIPHLTGGPRPIVGPGEKPWATRSDNPEYYGIARDEAAADRMLEDQAPLQTLKDRVREGLEPDLTIISGDSLIPPPSEQGTPTRAKPITLDAARSIDALVRRDALRFRLPQHEDWAARQVHGFGHTEAEVVRTLSHVAFPRELAVPNF
jgi:hypothetical protein